jgi:hypothetical protein
MSTQFSAPWHTRSYNRFLNELLPDLIASRLPLESCNVTATGPYICEISVILSSTKKAVHLRIGNIPRPDEEGVFEVGGRKVVVMPTASHAELDKAEIRCVGEQIYDFIKSRLSEAPPDIEWDESLAQAWLPLDRWMQDFFSDANPESRQRNAPAGTVQVLDEQNWLARCEHLRRILVTADLLPGVERVSAPGRVGRVCPIMTPEGQNIGRILYIARGAEIRDGKIVIADSRPEASLSVTASNIPLLEYDDPNRALMGANMMRQWLVPPEPEAALVQTGNEPDSPKFWCGRNLLTAFVSWGASTYMDGIVISESCAKRLSFGRQIEVGDKLSNCHGAKGVIAQIMPDDEMPHLSDGTPVELVFNFIGLHTRMNYGQIREAVLGRIAHTEGSPMIAPPFSGPTDEEIRRRLAKEGLSDNGMETLSMGKDGPSLERPSTVGWVYWGVTQHLSREKIKIGIAPQNKPTGLGELEYCALRRVKAFEIITELFNTQSSSREDSATLADRIAKGEIDLAAPPTPVFGELQRRLAAAGISAEFDGEKVKFSFANPPGKCLKLACPLPHPYLREQSLTEVGEFPGVPEFEALVEANSQTGRVLAGKSPESLVARSRENLRRAVQTFFEALFEQSPLSLHARVVFSGRAVAAPGDNLRIDQIGLPEEIAWALFGPMVIRELGDEQEARKRTKKATERLDKVMAQSWVVAWRTPTIEVTTLLSFHPVRASGPAIRLHPLVCGWMNADFDGDQIAVFLPLTAATQQEAAEKLSVIGHLRRDLSLIATLLPMQDSLWGLAELSRKEEGLQQIRSVIGTNVAAPEGFITREALIETLQQILEQEGEEKAVEVVQQLMCLGFDAAKQSGASVNVFTGRSLSAPEQPDPLSEDSYLRYLHEVENEITSRIDYDSDDIGPQLLAVKSCARGTVSHLITGLRFRAIRSIQGQLVFIPRGPIGGLRPEEMFEVAGLARRGLAQLALDIFEKDFSIRETFAPKGFNVFSRAKRLGCPGAVFARAAANGEVDPLTQLDARLFVGLRI